LVLVAALAVGGCSPIKAAAATNVTRYRCAQDQSFTVNRDANSAVVSYADENYTLARKPSSIGFRYASDIATLIIDDSYAAFVTDTTTDLQECEQRLA
jgi:hypothetical protein